MRLRLRYIRRGDPDRAIPAEYVFKLPKERVQYPVVVAMSELVSVTVIREESDSSSEGVGRQRIVGVPFLRAEALDPYRVSASWAGGQLLHLRRAIGSAELLVQLAS